MRWFTHLTQVSCVCLFLPCSTCSFFGLPCLVLNWCWGNLAKLVASILAILIGKLILARECMLSLKFSFHLNTDTHLLRVSFAGLAALGFLWRLGLLIPIIMLPFRLLKNIVEHCSNSSPTNKKEVSHENSWNDEKQPSHTLHVGPEIYGRCPEPRADSPKRKSSRS